MGTSRSIPLGVSSTAFLSQTVRSLASAPQLIDGLLKYERDCAWYFSKEFGGDSSSHKSFGRRRTPPVENISTTGCSTASTLTTRCSASAA
jgi:hypothetical protein